MTGKCVKAPASHSMATIIAAATSDEPDSEVHVTHIRPAEAEFVAAAAAWPLWDSTTHPQKPAGSGRFHFAYNGDYITERVLILTGRATLTPSDGSEAIEIAAGDCIYFHHGFTCDWHVHEPMTKRYAYFDAEGAEKTPAAIACDKCGVDCEAESYLVNGAEDLCPACYAASGKSGGEHQRMGEAVVEPKAKKARTAR